MHTRNLSEREFESMADNRFGNGLILMATLLYLRDVADKQDTGRSDPEGVHLDVRVRSVLPMNYQSLRLGDINRVAVKCIDQLRFQILHFPLIPFTLSRHGFGMFSTYIEWFIDLDTILVHNITRLIFG